MTKAAPCSIRRTLVPSFLCLLVLLVGQSSTQAQLPPVDVSPSSLTFNNQPVNTQSVSQTVTITNKSQVENVFVGTITITSPFQRSGGGGLLGPGASQTILVSFTPPTATTYTGSLKINISGGIDSETKTFTVNLTGTGVPAQAIAEITVPDVQFPSEFVGGSQFYQTVGSLRNNGNTNLIINSISLSNPSDFSVNFPAAGAVIVPGDKRQISATFHPQGIGSRASSVTITSNAVNSPSHINFSGSGVGPVELSLNPTSVTGGNGSTGTLRLNLPAPHPGSATLQSSQPAVASVPGSVSFAQGQSSAIFQVATKSVPNQTVVTISGTMAGITQQASLSVQPATPPVVLQQFTIEPSQVIGGESATGKLALSGPAPPGGASVSVISQTGSNVVHAPLNVTIPEGQSSKTFTLTTDKVTKETVEVFYAQYRGETRIASLRVLPVSTPPPLTLKSLALLPDRLVGGNPVTGRVTLSGAAPVGGAAVALNSSLAGIAPVPRQVTVPAGKTTEDFLLPTQPVQQTTSVTVTATFNGGSQAAVLTLLAAEPARPGRVVAVPDPVPVAGRLALIQVDPNPSQPGQEVTAIKARGDDGALWLVDYAGTALLSLARNGAARIRLDTSFLEGPNGPGLARLLKVETSSAGLSAVQALMADNTRRLYRLAKDGAPSTLAALADPRGAVPMAISPRGEIAYVAPDVSGRLTLIRVAADGTVTRLLTEGQEIGLGAPIKGFSDLTSSDDGQISVLVYGEDGSPEGVPMAVLRLRGTELQVVAALGAVVERGRGAGLNGVLRELSRPQIGPDGTIILEGSGDGFTNFYLQQPGQPLQPILPGTSWNREASFDFALGANGLAAVRAAQAESLVSHLYLRLPSGGVLPVAVDPADARPIGQPVFSPGGLLFFLAEHPELPADRNGRNLVGLYRARLVNGNVLVQGVAEPQQEIPGWVDAHLLGITQRPVVTDSDLYFGVVFGGPENSPVPTAALFRVPVEGNLKQGELVAEEGQPLEAANRLAMPRDLALRGDGSLIFYGLLPGAGPLIAAVTGTASTASLPARPAATAAASIRPLMATGDDLMAGLLENVLPPLLSVGLENVLFVARTSPSRGAAKVPNREGLYLVKQERQGTAVAVTNSQAPSLPGLLYSGLADDQPLAERIFNLSPQSVAADGSVVFKSRLRRTGDGPNVPPLVGVFRWGGSSDPISVLLSNAPPISGALSPLKVERVAAGPGGRVYSLVRSGGNGPRMLLASTASGRAAATTATPLAQSGSSLAGGGQLKELTDFVVNGNGDLFVTGVSAAGAGLFLLPGGEPGPLQPIVLPGTKAPAPPGDPQAPLTFLDRPVQLLPSSALGEPLVFQAQVLQRGRATTGQFTYASGGLRTLCTELILVRDGDRNQLVVNACPDTVELQNRRGDRVFADIDGRGNWTLTRVLVDAAGKEGPAKVIAAVGQALPGAGDRRVKVLDAGPLLETGAAKRHGPVFTLNAAGDVAFLASDGISWGAYRVTAE